MPIRFGTDGWRGIIAQDFTFENVKACAQGLSDYLLESGAEQRGLVVGYDTRFASENFAQTVAEVTAGNGIKTYLCDGPAPTPVVSYSIVERKTAGAVIITASHNPAIWNGFKYKSEYAGSASTEEIEALESRISKTLTRGKTISIPIEQGLKQGVIEYVDPVPPYLDHVVGLLDLPSIRKAGLKVAVDSMYGAGAGYFVKLLSGEATQLEEIHGERNPLFPGMKQPEPIAQNLTQLSALVKQTRADIGLATDGDADRIGIVDENGSFVTPLQTFALLALYLLDVRNERGAIVKTITTTQMLYKLGELYNVPVFETGVGFKYVGPLMLRENALIGGEESGGFGFRGHIPERDGLLAGLYFLDLMVKLKKTPSELVRYLYEKVGPHFYSRVDVRFHETQRREIIARLSKERPPALDETPVSRVDTIDGFRYTLKDGTWLLIRFSGTEPLLRIYAESDSPERVERLLYLGKRLAGV
ncbi:MAG: phosphoglucomutase/phosphomannomutase family protein [Chloroflexi bacterium]|nr:phosphoglucomutase/phosphomannomutase family protein [Chloroflexota bacterium]